MSLECGECERDLRGPHEPGCSRSSELKIGDASAEIWIHGRGRRMYALDVVSSTTGKGHRYAWAVESYRTEKSDGPFRVDHGSCGTFQEALNRAAEKVRALEKARR